jgi:hypothetical protein
MTPPDFDWRRPSSFCAVALCTLRRPAAYFRSLEGARGLGPPAGFILATLALSQALRAAALAAGPGLQAIAWGGLVGSAGWAFVQALLWTGALHLTATRVLGSRLAAAGTLRVVAYSGVVWLAAFAEVWLPAWGRALMMAGLTAAHLYLSLRGLMSLGRLSLPMAAACLLVALVGVMVAAALVAQLWA